MGVELDRLPRSVGADALTKRTGQIDERIAF